MSDLKIEVEQSERWFVWTKWGRKPTYVHLDQTAAMNEAERLARLHPGQKFHVLRSICKVGLIGENCAALSPPSDNEAGS